MSTAGYDLHPRVQRRTIEIMAGRKRLAQDARITPEHVSRALSRLVEIGALLKLRPGRYAINPNAGWAGNLSTRQEAAQHVQPVLLPVEPPVRLIEP